MTCQPRFAGSLGGFLRAIMRCFGHWETFLHKILIVSCFSSWRHASLFVHPFSRWLSALQGLSPLRAAKQKAESRKARMQTVQTSQTSMETLKWDKQNKLGKQTRAFRVPPKKKRLHIFTLSSLTTSRRAPSLPRLPCGRWQPLHEPAGSQMAQN